MSQIVGWRPELRIEFERLNREWIEQYFVVEQEDLKVFEDPAGQIVAPGGEIFFVLDESGVQGTCAVIRHDAETSSSPRWRGARRPRSGIWRPADGGGRSPIATGRRRAPAHARSPTTRPGRPPSRLYRKHGFREVPRIDPANGYARADIQTRAPADHDH